MKIDTLWCKCLSQSAFVISCNNSGAEYKLSKSQGLFSQIMLKAAKAPYLEIIIQNYEHNCGMYMYAQYLNNYMYFLHPQPHTSISIHSQNKTKTFRECIPPLG